LCGKERRKRKTKSEVAFLTGVGEKKVKAQRTESVGRWKACGNELYENFQSKRGGENGGEYSGGGWGDERSQKGERKKVNDKNKEKTGSKAWEGTDCRELPRVKREKRGGEVRNRRKGLSRGAEKKKNRGWGEKVYEK